MSLALCQHVVCQAPQHLLRHKPLVMVASPTCQSTWSFPLILAYQWQYIHRIRSLQSWMTHASLGFPFHFSLFVASSEDDSMCGLTVTLWGNPAKSMCGCFHLHGQGGSWDLLGCSIFMGGGHTLLDCEAPPCLVCGDWAISHEFLRFAVFMNEKLDLWIYFACWPFSAAFSQAFWKECLIDMPESVWVPSHSLVCLSSQLVYLTASIHLFDPPSTCHISACILLSFSQLHGVGFGDFQQHWSMLWSAALSVWLASLGDLTWTAWSQWLCPWWFLVWLLLPCSALCAAFSRFVCATVRPSL